ncbi:CHAT domain-containing protein [Mycena galericulata]|nr:CHAT domain-containing protein [Mycena galericulata]
MLRKGVTLLPDGHRAKGFLLSALGDSLRGRFERLGDLGDLNTSILLLSEAVTPLPDGHPMKALWLSKLGSSLFLRFHQLGTLGDLDESIKLLRKGVTLLPDGHHQKGFLLSALGDSLRGRFERLGDLDDLNTSILLLSKAVTPLSDGHPMKALWLRKLGSSLLCRFHQLSDLGDLNESVESLEKAVRLLPEGHREKPSLLNALGVSLLGLFERLGDLDDLATSVLLFESSVALAPLPDGHPSSPSGEENAFISGMLGDYPRARFQRVNSVDDLNESVQMLKEATALCPDMHPDKSGFLINIIGRVVRHPAMTALAGREYKKAIEWLEQGRSIIWGQILSLRSPVDSLKQTHPDLAEKLEFLTKELERSATRDNSPQRSSASQFLQETAQKYHELNHEWAILLKEIREMDRFDRFLLPKGMSELSLAAVQGPVVVLNISVLRCDALILKPGLDDVLHFPLQRPAFDHAELRKTLGTLLHSHGRSAWLMGQQGAQMHREQGSDHILSELWMKIVKPVLEALDHTNPDLHRIWWCPTGPSALRPIHAAKLSDSVIYSYTPSLIALIEGFRSRSDPQESLRLLAVAQPSAEDLAYILGTQTGMHHIQRLAKGTRVLRLEEDAATLDSIQNEMRSCRWVHFACHGVQDVSAPTESALLAGDPWLTLPKTIQSHPKAELAFLSACQAATGADDLQAVHLAAGLLSAGYRGVVATMWSIMDQDPQVAADVYGHLFDASPLDSTRAAQALHLAGRRLILLLEGSERNFAAGSHLSTGCHYL